ncbi:MAG: argininosuccinate lyase [Spirochaetota bacterium]|nr:MAG: argininosuccinate lyase [Spirochaetota bacterium]
MTLRDGRLNVPLHESFKKLGSSVEFDKRLFHEDIKGSEAYTKALCKRGIIKKKEEELILKGLREIEKEIESGKFRFKEEDEDIHMNIERRLFEKIGETAYKLHTGRSRNEQIVLDERLYLMDVTETVKKKLGGLLKAILGLAKRNIEVIVPSYTHLRQAQPVSIAHLLLAYCYALLRGKERFGDFKKRLNTMPLGSGACAGSSIGIDRDFLKKELGFESITRNSIDAVSTRDFIAEFEWICGTLFITFSRMCEDIIILSSEEFSIYTIPDELSTTSSLMPQKKNPDPLELVRGKSARVIGNLFSLMVLMKGIPYTYNRDLQEDKEGLFDTVDNTLLVFDVMTELFRSIKLNKKVIAEKLGESKDLLFATDLVDYLVERGVAFRKAHGIVGQIAKFAVDRGIQLRKIPIDEYKKFCSSFAEDLYEIFSWERSVNRHDVPGGTALNRITEEIKNIESISTSNL